MYGCHRVTTTSSRDAPPIADLTPREKTKRANQWNGPTLLFCNLWFSSLLASSHSRPHRALYSVPTLPPCVGSLLRVFVLRSHLTPVIHLHLLIFSSFSLGVTFLSSLASTLSLYLHLLSPAAASSPPQSKVKGRWEFRGRSPSPLFSQWLITSYSDQREVCVSWCVSAKERIIRKNKR